MTVEGFKGIFWWEYIHRLLGRVIGLAFLVPFLWFLARRRLEPHLAWKLAGIFVLGALQGAMGWYMVASGLVDDPRVSQFRLTAHLTLAFLIYAAMFWVALGILHPERYGAPAGLRRLATAVVILVFAMVVTGGLVAGIRAGYAYNTFPLMNGHFIPPEILLLQPWWKNLGYNMATVQFDHRIVAWALAFLVPATWIAVRRAHGLTDQAGWAANALLIALAIQIALGISTLLLKVPLGLGAAHQAGAVVVLTCALWLRHALRKNRGQARNFSGSQDPKDISPDPDFRSALGLDGHQRARPLGVRGDDAVVALCSRRGRSTGNDRPRTSPGCG